MTGPSVAVLDYGSGNVHSVVRALTHVGADVELTADRSRVLEADGLLVPGVGNFHACMAGLRAADGPWLVDTRLAGGSHRGLDATQTYPGTPPPRRGSGRAEGRPWGCVDGLGD